MIENRPVVLIALMSLAAEGTPRLAISLCREWLQQGIRPIIAILQATPTDLAPELHEMGVECIILDIPKAGFYRYVVLAVKFFLLARRYRAKALLSMPLGWHTFMAIGARLGGVRHVVAHVGNYPNTTARFAFTKFRILVQSGRPLTDRLVCCSHHVKRGTIEHFGVSERETAVVYNGVSCNAFDRKPSMDRRSPGLSTIGMVARLEKHKDQATLIRAAKILKDGGRDIAVTIIGEGSQHSALRHLIHTLSLSGSVMLLGMRRDIPNILAELDIFAFSTTADEGFGIALVEAMLGGIPVIASDVGACREVLDEGSLGLLVPAGDPRALAQAIESVLASPRDAKSRAMRARNKAINEFSVHAMARAYGELLGLLPGTEPASEIVGAKEQPA